METAELINQLGVRHRVTAAYRTLFGMGFAAVPAAQEGLRHENADVRYHCLRLLDHFLMPEALSELIGMLRDPAPQVRAMAIEVVGQYVHANPMAERALVEARTNDPSPAVRKKAGWYAPGGPIHTRIAPRPARKARRR